MVVARPGSYAEALQQTRAPAFKAPKIEAAEKPAPLAPALTGWTPDKVSSLYNAAHAAQAPAWVNPDILQTIDAAQNWMKQTGGAALPTEMVGLLDALPTWQEQTAEAAQPKGYWAENVAPIGQAPYANYGMTEEAWNNLSFGQKLAMRAFSTNVAAGVTTGALAGAQGGPLGAATGAVFGYSLAKIGERFPAVAKIGEAFDFLVENAVMRPIGTSALLYGAAQSGDKERLQELTGNLDKAWLAGEQVFRTNLMNTGARPENYMGAQLTPEQQQARSKEVWAGPTAPTEYTTITPDKMGTAALQEYFDRLQDGEAPEDINRDFEQRYGFEGQMTDLAARIFLDPLNYIGGLAGKGIGTTGKLLGASDDFARAFDWAGPIEGRKKFREAAKLMSPDEANSLKFFEKWASPYTKEGAPKLTNLPEPFNNPISKSFGYLARQLPETKAKEFVSVVSQNISVLGDRASRNPREFLRMIKAIADNPPEAAAELGRFAGGSEMRAAVPALRDQLPGLQRVVDDYYNPAIEQARGSLDNVAARANITTPEMIKKLIDPNTGDTYARSVLAQVADAARKSGDDGAEILRMIESGGLSPESLADMAGAFKEGGIPLSEKQLMAKLYAELIDGSAKWSAKYFGVVPDAWPVRLSNAIKMVQGALLLDANVTFGFQNVTDNSFKLGREGVLFGFTPKGAQAYIDDLLGEGLRPTRIAEGYVTDTGAPRRYETAIEAAKRIEGDKIQGVSDFASKIRSKNPVSVSKWSGAAEENMRLVGNAVGIRQTMNQLDRVGKGIDRMPRQLEDAIRAQGGDPRNLYRMVDGDHNVDRIVSRMFGDTPELRVDDVLDATAEAMGENGAAMRDLFDRTGVSDFLRERLPANPTREQIAQAMGDLRDQTRKQFNDMSKEQKLARMEKAANKAQAEGPVGIFEVFDDIGIERGEQRLYDWMEWDEIWSLKGQIPEESFGTRVQMQYNYQRDVYRRLNENTRAGYLGSIEKLGADSNYTRLLADNLVADEALWSGFFDTVKKEYRDFFKKRGKESYESQNARWVEVRERLAKLYDDTSTKALDLQAQRDGDLINLIGTRYGEPARAAAEAWLQGVREIDAEMYQGMKDFRDRVSKLPGDQRNKAWSDFLRKEHKPAIVERMRRNREGANEVYAMASEAERMGQVNEQVQSPQPAPLRVEDIQPKPETIERVRNEMMQEAEAQPPERAQYKEFINTTRGELPEQLSNAVKNEAEALRSELLAGEPGRRIFTYVENQAHPIVSGQASTNADWYRKLYFDEGLNRKAVENAINRIIENHGKDDPRFNNVRAVKDLILDRLMGKVDPDTGTEIPAHPSALMFLGKEQEAAQALREWMDLYPEFDYQDMVSWAGSDEALGRLTDILEGRAPEALPRPPIQLDEAAVLQRAREIDFAEATKGTERRQPAARGMRAEIERLNGIIDQLKKDNEGLKTDPSTGLRLGTYHMDEINAAPIKMAVDVSGLGYLNDAYSHKAGDILLKNFAETIAELGHKGYRNQTGGDEFTLIFNSLEEARAAEARLHEVMRNKQIPAVSKATGQATVLTGFDVRAGIADTLEAADAAERAVKAEQNIPKGSKPPTVTELTGAGLQEALDRWSKEVGKPTFQQWFEGSKVVDAEGKPLKVYHGTTTDFSAFKESADIGIHFGNLDQATKALESRNVKKFGISMGGDSPNIRPAYIKIDNPLRMPDLQNWDFSTWIADWLHESGLIDKAKYDEIELTPGGGKARIQKAKEVIQELGYDGIVYENKFEGNGDSYIVFDNSQIRPAYEGDVAMRPAPDPDPVGIAPPGTVDGIYGHPEYDMQNQGWHEYVAPALRELERQLADPANAPTNVKGMNLDAATTNGIKTWLEQVRGQKADVKLTALKWGALSTDMAMLNYSNRRGFDNILNMFAPYQFWYTRSMMNWALTAIDKPAWFANWYRLREMQEKMQRPVPGLPARLSGKLQARIPFMPEGWGDTIFYDPWHQVFGFEAMVGQVMRPLMRDFSNTRSRAEYILQEQMQNEEISQDDYTAAINTQQGPLWEQAYQRAQAEVESEIASPVDLVSTMLAPSLPLAWALERAGLKSKGLSSTLPAFATVQNLTSFITPGGYHIPSIVQQIISGKPTDATQQDSLRNYYVMRELANMAVQGADPDAIEQAMVERQGPLWEQALGTIGRQQAVRSLGALLWADFFPEGEQRQRAIKEEFVKAADAGQLPAFFDKYPEYQSRMMLRNADDPEALMKQFLISEAWNARSALPELERKQVEGQLGELYQDAFLNKATRSYDSIDVPTLVQWVQAFRGTVPSNAPKVPQANIERPPQQTTDAFTEYRNWQQTQPGYALSNMMWKLPEGMRDQFKLMHPEVTAYDDQRNVYLSQHPELIPYALSENNRLADAPFEVAQEVIDYYAERAILFPMVTVLQAEFYNLPKREQSAFLRQFPELKDYWDWSKERKDMLSNAAYPYVVGESGMEKLRAGDDYEAPYRVDYDSFDPALTLALASATMTRSRLGEGAMKKLRQQWEREGKPLGSFEAWQQVVLGAFTVVPQ